MCHLTSIFSYSSSPRAGTTGFNGSHHQVTSHDHEPGTRFLCFYFNLCLYHYYFSLFTPVPFRFTRQLNLHYLFFFDTMMTSSAGDGVVLGGHELTRHVQSCLNRRMALLLEPRPHAEQPQLWGGGIRPSLSDGWSFRVHSGHSHQLHQ